MSSPSAPGDDATLDPAEVARFAALAGEWWDPDGKFRPLHRLGPARMGFVRRQTTRHFARPNETLRPLLGLTVLDVGCGGGLVSEPLARLGGDVLGLDPAGECIEAARPHAQAAGFSPDGDAGQGRRLAYRAGRLEDLVEEGRTFDVVLALEVVEHVPDVPAFLALLARAVAPGGLVVLSTLNRTMKAWLLAIVGAEYVLGWLPVGTHQWERFVTPDELARNLRAAGLAPGGSEGLVYDPLKDTWSLGADHDVNYLMSASR